MASAQCHKPSEQTNHHQVHSSTYHKKTETHHDKNNHSTNGHTFSDKVKEMAHSARKMFNHHDHQKPSTGNCSTEKKVKPMEGHDGHCMPRMLDHMKGKKKSKVGKHNISNSDGGSSSDDSDHETAKKKD